MSAYDNARAEAAKWMWDREDKRGDGIHFWRHTVFTADNPDPETLRHNPKMAFTIFGDLVERGLLTYLPDDGRGPMYMINHGKDAEWQRIMHHHYYFFRDAGAKVGDYIAGGVIGAVLGIIVTALVSWRLCGG